jgi:hypothetical protein
MVEATEHLLSRGCSNMKVAYYCGGRGGLHVLVAVVFDFALTLLSKWIQPRSNGTDKT